MLFSKISNDKAVQLDILHHASFFFKISGETVPFTLLHETETVQIDSIEKYQISFEPSNGFICG